MSIIYCSTKQATLMRRSTVLSHPFRLVFPGKSISCVLVQGLYSQHFIFFVTYELYEKTTCQNYIKFISNIISQMYKTLQLFTDLITLNSNIFTNIKNIKTLEHIFMQTQKILKMPSSLKLGFNLNRS
jgi:hypothetical protein